MVLLMLTLLSLNAIYFTRLLKKRKMRTAAVSVTVLYAYIIIWIYAIFILDVAGLGFSDAETYTSLIHGSNIYHSFVEVTARMAVIPLPLLHAIVGVAGIILLSAFAVALHGIFDLSQEIINSLKKKGLTRHVELKQNNRIAMLYFCKRPLIRLYCRANC